MKKVALLTCNKMDNFVSYESSLEQSFKRQNIAVEWVVWNDNINWNNYSYAIIRTTWDYFDYLSEFLKVIDQIKNSSCVLFNPESIVRWNCDKKYLKDLRNKGVNIVQTIWRDPKEFNDLTECFKELNCQKIVIKPQVGAGAIDTFVLDLNNKNNWQDVINVSKNKKLLMQPFMDNIKTEGEYSLHFFNKKHSHTILKKPKAGDFRSQEEYGSYITKVEPDSLLLQGSKQVLSLLDEPILYARIDWVRGADNKYLLMELELIEPSLYFDYDSKSADFFVKEFLSLL